MWRWTQVLPASPAAPSCADTAMLHTTSVCNLNQPSCSITFPAGVVVVVQVVNLEC